MARQTTKDVLLGDPLSSVTRRERRLLLGVSIFGIAIVKTGLVPSKISVLGIEFAQTDQQALLIIIATVELYFLCAFAIYAASDLLAWRKALRRERINAARERFRREGQVSPEIISQEDLYVSRHLPSGRLIFTFSRPLSILRAVFEFVVPVVVAIYAILLLFFHRMATNGN